jgi:uncharacterized damage-inducible protein DinB
MRFALMITLAAAPLWCQDAAKNPQLAGAKAFFEIAKTDVLRSVEKMPEAKFGFRPSDDVRTYGQLLAHVADGQFELCGMAKEGKPIDKSFEKSAMTKAAILQALNQGFAYCDSAYAGLTDATSAAMVNWFGNQPRTKLSILGFNTAHTMEHYGNLVTYMRMNKIVPPSSAPAQ